MVLSHATHTHARKMDYIEDIKEDTQQLKEMLLNLKNIQQKETDFFNGLISPKTLSRDSSLTPMIVNSLLTPRESNKNSPSDLYTPLKRNNSLYSSELDSENNKNLQKNEWTKKITFE